MLITIPDVLTPEEVVKCRALLRRARWADGRITAGTQSAKAKHNSQVPDTDSRGREAASIVMVALERNQAFISAALPRHIFPPLFNRYDCGDSFGNHVDNAIRSDAGGRPVRTDLSATLFLEAPENYGGGELVIEDTYGPRTVKLPRGHMVLYPSTSLHNVTPVTRGARLAAFFWVQSLVRADAQRALLWDMDRAIMGLRTSRSDDPELVSLTACYHNLVRMWADL